MSKWIQLLWLSFFTAIVGETVFFAVLDPKQLYLFGEPVSWSPVVVYSVGFFMFWSLTGLTAALVALQLKPGAAVNQEPKVRVRRKMTREELASADTEIGP
jgi:hypothetical protein